MQERVTAQDRVVLGVGKGFESGVGFRGRLTIRVFDSSGQLIQAVSDHNTITVAGHNGLADQILFSPTLAKPAQMAVGTGTPSTTALGAELSRVPFSSLTRSTNQVTAIANWGTGVATGTLTEAGIFDAAVAGNMWASASFAPITKNSGDTLQITWVLTVG